MTRSTAPQPRGTQPFGAWSAVLILIIMALKSISTVPREGLGLGLVQSLVFALVLVALFKLIFWPISVLTALPAVVKWLKRVPAVVLVLAWVCAPFAIYQLDPDHGILHRHQLPIWPGLIVEWVVILFTPMLTIRWFKVRKSVAREVPVPHEVPLDSASPELAPIAAQWHTRRDLESPEKGPFDTATIREALKDGSVSARVLIRRHDEDQWGSLQDHPDFQGGTAAAQPPARSAAFDDALNRMRSARDEADDTRSAGSSPSSWKRVAWLAAGACACLAVVFGVIVFAKRRPSPAVVALSPVPWQYHSPEHLFSLTFPSAAWQLLEKNGDQVVFRGDRPGVMVRAAIALVEPLTREEFATGKEKLRARALGNDKLVGKPVFSEGVTQARDPYLIAHYLRRVAPVSYGAAAMIWLRARGLGLQLTFDAQRADTRNLDHSEFEREAEAILLSLADGTKQPERDPASAASAAPTQASQLMNAGSKPSLPAAPLQFAFDWAPPCRVRVLDHATDKDHDTRMLYTIAVNAGNHDELLVRLEGFAMLQMDGVDVTGREWQPRLKPLVEMAAATPGFEVSRAGRFRKIESGYTSQKLVELMIAQSNQTPEASRNFRTIMASPAMAVAVQGELVDEWTTWVEAWLGWALAPGTTRDEVTRAPSGLPMKRRREFVALNDGFASLRMTSTMTGAAVGRSASLYTAELVRGAWPREFPKNAINDARIVETVFAETRPETLRPRHTRWQRYVEMKFADGTQRTNEQSHDLEWDWEHSSGCASAARP